ncbi:MAG: hypothetical protein HKN68_14505 [Saprospiraceae bacterium]|nr:hypothetical protein [Saprospiraceae bacterium]
MRKKSSNISNIILPLIGFSLISLMLSCTKAEGPEILSFSPDFGPKETLITVEGMNFDELTSIHFDNEILANFNPSFGTNTALLFRVPEQAPLGENQVVIQTEAGETSFPFRVTLEPPEIFDFNPKSANEGELVSILGKNFFEPLEILFFDSIPGNIIHSQEDSILVEVPSNVKKGRIKVKANGGSALTGEVFFSTTDILVNDFDGNGFRSETEKWLFYGNIDQNVNTAVQSSNPAPIEGNYLKISGIDPGSIWIGGTESHSNDPEVFSVFEINSDIDNTFIELDINNNGSDKTHLIIVLAERNGSPNDFTHTIHVDGSGWKSESIPLNRFKDVDGFTIDPSKIRVVKLHLYNELRTNRRLEVNIDNLKFIQIN